jgi:hypothetical protein
VETFLTGPQYTADGYFDESGNVQIITVSWAPKDPTNPADIREIVLGTDLRILRAQRPVCADMMEKIQQAASERYPFATQKKRNKFFHNFPFMVEYRVNPQNGRAFPIEVNSMRHEGKSPAYASLLYEVPLYDFFFRGLRFHEEFLKKDILSNDNTVAAMIFARKPDIDFPADSMDFSKWTETVQRQLSVSQSEDEDLSSEIGHTADAALSPENARESLRLSRTCSRFVNGNNYFFGWARGYYSGWNGLLQLVSPGWEKPFVMEQ